MLAAPALIHRSMTNYCFYWAGVSGKGTRIFQDGGQIKREKDINTTVRDQYLSFAIFQTPLFLFGRAFPHILEKPSSYMSLHLIPFEFSWEISPIFCIYLRVLNYYTYSTTY